MKRIFLKKNLKLAWRRLTTARNLPYKNYFRDLFRAYEAGLDPNINDLRERIHTSFKPSEPIKLYMPKPSGLQRPITLLNIEDQIVYQAIANIFAERLRARLDKVQLTGTFSNTLEKGNGDYFLKPWRHGYKKFQDKITEYYNNGLRWVAHYDLAAYYDTICHDLLLRVAFPRQYLSEDARLICKWLKVWSADSKPCQHQHGIPQGLIASDFLSECFLLPVDEEMLKKKRAYVRYVDDIRLFAQNEQELRAQIIELEVLLRNRGLIPEAKKMAIIQADSIKKALGSLPSLAPDKNELQAFVFFIRPQEAVRQFRTALAGKPQRIDDKSRAKYILFNAWPSEKLTQYVFRLMPHHPEHIEAFATYMQNVKLNRSQIKILTNYLHSTPYEYVQGKIWEILSEKTTKKEKKSLLQNAINIAENPAKSVYLRFATCKFLCFADRIGIIISERFVMRQREPFLKSLLIPYLPDRIYKPTSSNLVKLLKNESFEPALVLAEQLIKYRIPFKDLKVPLSKLHSQTRNVFNGLNILSAPPSRVDPISEFLRRRYGISSWNWRKLLKRYEYHHAVQLLSLAESSYDGSKSQWLMAQNSFNHAVFLQLQKFLGKHNLSGVIPVTDKYNKPITYGNLLSKTNKFSTSYPQIADGFRNTNTRRNKLPVAHPYEQKTSNFTSYLRPIEQIMLKGQLEIAYQEIINLCAPHFTRVNAEHYL